MLNRSILLSSSATPVDLAGWKGDRNFLWGLCCKGQTSYTSGPETLFFLVAKRKKKCNGMVIFLEHAASQRRMYDEAPESWAAIHNVD